MIIVPTEQQQKRWVDGQARGQRSWAEVQRSWAESRADAATKVATKAANDAATRASTRGDDRGSDDQGFPRDRMVIDPGYIPNHPLSPELDPDVVAARNAKHLGQVTVDAANALLQALGIVGLFIILLGYVRGTPPFSASDLASVAFMAGAAWLCWSLLVRGGFQRLIMFATIGGCGIWTLVDWSTDNNGGATAGFSGVIFLAIVVMLLNFFPANEAGEAEFRGGGGYIGYREVTGGDNS